MMMKINFLLLSIFLFACSSLQTNREQNVSIMQQLESDYSNEKLTDNEFYTYLTYSVFNCRNYLTWTSRNTKINKNFIHLTTSIN